MGAGQGHLIYPLFDCFRHYKAAWYSYSSSNSPSWYLSNQAKMTPVIVGLQVTGSPKALPSAYSEPEF